MERIYLLTHPRSASNLLVQILGLEDQPNVKARPHAGYYFLDTLIALGDMGLRAKHVDEWTEEERTKVQAMYQKGYEEMMKDVDKSKEEGRISVVKEHANVIIGPSHQTKFMFKTDDVKEAPLTLDVAQGSEVVRSPGNHTIFSDEFLLTWKPVFLIRHPALMFPSFYRCMDDFRKMQKEEIGTTGSLEAGKPDLPIYMSFHNIRSMYDWYSEKLNQVGSSSTTQPWPIVIDADDVIADETVVLKLADIIGLDRNHLKFTWNPVSEEDSKKYNPMAKRMLSSLNASNGIMKDKLAANIDIEAEATKWKAEFGEIDGAKMHKWVTDAMPDYEYLKSRRLTA
ncbi:hypothetical protein McanMca71_005480 [Microsporum canis]|uniref:Sulfotransferase domain-containing protein n=1 Tax=Arthroderma otae (strain ATCC MYA-4605 / CBS 113480) TaxID=554155 RepID=C5FQH7_ARTOC|nr:conserved hypothetical protein [Microsporum canis CBS 113480]EEQ32130.1 conserved hypothetical protein [Microsporum canis CBS 113480]